MLITAAARTGFLLTQSVLRFLFQRMILLGGWLDFMLADWRSCRIRYKQALFHITFLPRVD